MNTEYNIYGSSEPCFIHLCDLNQKKECTLNSVVPDTCSITKNLKDFDEITFTLNKYIDNSEGNQMVSNGYNNIQIYKIIYVDHTGYFIISEEPSVSNDGLNETKEVYAKSLEYQFTYKNITDFKINTGESTSLERLVPDNINAAGITQEYISFYHPEHTALSLLDILLDYVNGWSVGYIDPLIAVKKVSFSIDNQDVYSFLMQNVASACQCMFIFDTAHKTVNAFAADTFGEDTNIYISFRNLANQINISPSTDNLYTRFCVRGNDSLDISQVNFGEEQIEDLSYFMTTKYVSQDLIDKYNAWLAYREERRPDYVSKMKEFAAAQEARDEIVNRVPCDSLNYKWNSYNKEELDKELKFFTELVTCIENDFKDTSGKIDLAALKASPYWWDYNSYTTWVIPNIRTALSNLNKPDSQKDNYDESWKTNWDLYGTDELASIITSYQKKMTSVSDYKKPWSQLTPEEKKLYTGEAAYTTVHNQYIEQETNCRNAQAKYNTLMQSVNSYQSQMDSLKNTDLADIVSSVSIENSKFGFTQEQLDTIEKLYVDTDYTNENFLITSRSSQENKLEEEQKLMAEAMEELSRESRPQYSFSCELDNLLALPEFKEWHVPFDVGNFIRLGTDDTHQEKLRLMSITYNPMMYDNNISVEFSNITVYRGQRNDLTDIFGNAVSSSKNGISYSSAGSGSGNSVDSELIKYILNSRLMDDTVENLKLESLSATQADIKAAMIGYAKIDQLDTTVGNFITANADMLFTNYVKTNDLTAALSTVAKLQSGDLVVSDSMQIVSDNGNLIMNSKALQIKGLDADGNQYVGVQLGYDSADNPSLILRNSSGILLLSPDGITENAVADGLIVDKMIGDKEISPGKLSFHIETDDSGNVLIENLYTETGTKFGVDYTTFKADIYGDGTSQKSGVLSVVDGLKNSITNRVWRTDTFTVTDGSGIKTKTLQTCLSDISQTADKISWIVKGGTSSSNFTLTDRVAALVAETIKIKGNMIVDGSISASKINVNDLFAQTITATGAIQSKNYVAGSTGIKLLMSTGQIDSKYFKVSSTGAITATSGKVGGFNIRSTYLANGTTTIAGAENSVYLGTDGISCGLGFKASSTGNVEAIGTFKTISEELVGGDFFCEMSGSEIKIISDRWGSSNDTSLNMTADKIIMILDMSGSYGPYQKLAIGPLGIMYSGLTDKENVEFSAAIGNAFIAADDSVYISSKNGVNITGDTSVTGKLSVNGYKTAYALSTPSFICNSWVRTVGNTGWYNETYGGGWYMADTTYIRPYGNKKLLLSGGLDITSGECNSACHLRFANGKGVYGKTTAKTDVNLIKMSESNNVQVGATGYDTFVYCPGGRGMTITNDRINPGSDNGFYGGDSSHRYKRFYAVNGTISTSDRNYKHNIKPLKADDKYHQLFMKLNPVSFMFNGGDRLHIGAISQDVEAAMKELGIKDTEFAGFCRDIKMKDITDPETGDTIRQEPELDADGNPVYLYSLCYQEFIFQCVKEIQTLIKRHDEETSRINTLEKEIEELKHLIKSA